MGRLWLGPARALCRSQARARNLHRPTLNEWREKLYALIHKQSTRGFFKPAEGAPPGAEARAILAAKSLNSTSFDTLVAWLENTDGLSDEQRFTWWGRIIREWHQATREAYQLNGPDQKT